VKNKNLLKVQKSRSQKFSFSSEKQKNCIFLQRKKYEKHRKNGALRQFRSKKTPRTQKNCKNQKIRNFIFL
jgi:hypothetical protein